MKGRCQSCKHFTPLDDKLLGICSRIYKESKEACLAMVPSGGLVFLNVRPGFGCVLWEEER